MKKDSVNILEVGVSRDDLQQTMDKMALAIEKGDKLRIVVTPVNCILWAKKDPKLREIYNSADIATADGVPLVWASKWLGEPIRGRVTGLDLLPEFSKIACKRGFRYFFLGAGPGVAEKLADELTTRNPGLHVAGSYSPPFAEEFTEDENQKMINMINQSGADVLWVSLTAPKQDFWIAEHFDKLQVHVAIGVGAAFDVVSGNIKRAPLWMQKNGLEWFYRLLMEPGRLAKRYLIEAPRFIPLVVIQKFRKPSGQQ